MPFDQISVKVAIISNEFRRVCDIELWRLMWGRFSCQWQSDKS